MKRVIIVDDEPWILLGLKKTFKWEAYGFEVVKETTDPEEAFEEILNHKPEVVFTDIRMPQITGIELIRKLREKGCTSEFVIVSGYADFEYAREAIKYGVFDYCLKPVKQCDADELIARLKGHFESKEKHVSGNDQENQEQESLAHININNIQFKELIDYIHENYHKKLYLNELAKTFYLNSNYCCYLFKKIFNCNFSDYITEIRMKEAAKLLEDPFVSTNEVAEKVGYDDYFYFNKVFKKHFGITPYKYKGNKK